MLEAKTFFLLLSNTPNSGQTATCYRKNVQNLHPISDQNSLKTICFSATQYTWSLCEVHYRRAVEVRITCSYGRKVSLAINTKADSLLLIPRPPLADEDLCPAISLGMEHRTFPVLQPTPHFSRCCGHTVSNVWNSSIINTPTQSK